MMKRIGTYNGVPLYEDPDCPPGQIYFLNDKYVRWARFEPLSRWQRFLVTLKRMVRNGKL